MAKVAGHKVGGRKDDRRGGRGGGRGGHGGRGGKRRDGDSDSFDVKTKGGVLHLNRKRLPGKLAGKAFGR